MWPLIFCTKSQLITVWCEELRNWASIVSCQWYSTWIMIDNLFLWQGEHILIRTLRECRHPSSRQLITPRLTGFTIWSQHGDPAKPQNLINCFLYHCRVILKISSNLLTSYWVIAHADVGWPHVGWCNTVGGTQTCIYCMPVNTFYFMRLTTMQCAVWIDLYN